MAFQARLRSLPGALVEIERYNPAPPRQLPDDELITRTARTDPQGVVTATLTDPGWWCLTVAAKGEPRQHRGKEYPLRRRSILWLFVDEKPGAR
jgi:hypothetical protein